MMAHHSRKIVRHISSPAAFSSLWGGGRCRGRVPPASPASVSNSAMGPDGPRVSNAHTLRQLHVHLISARSLCRLQTLAANDPGASVPGSLAGGMA